MNSFIDIIMIILFVFFMIFIFGGYHKNKSAQREHQRTLEEAQEKKQEDLK